MGFIDQADVIVMGCPTYMGSLTSALKQFMEDSLNVGWHVHGRGNWLLVLPMVVDLSGDKLAVLQQINLFAMQHGMLWAGLPFMPTGRSHWILTGCRAFWV
jgi:NAD(P)H dehydrogenase (quinone)